MEILNEFTKRTAFLPSPFIYRKWTAIGIISAALHRNVWTATIRYATGELPLWGNQYVLLCGPSGTGKTLPIGVAKPILKRAGVRLAPDDVTHEKLLYKMADKHREGQYDLFAEGEMACWVSEFGTFMKGANVDMQQAIADIWNCPPDFERSTVKHGDVRIDKPFLNIMAGVQPAWFTTGLSAENFEMGLPSRLLIVFSKETMEIKHGDIEADDPVGILPAVKRIREIEGYFKCTDDAVGLLNQWETDGRPPKRAEFDGSFLHGYAKRRGEHVAKLALVRAVDKFQAGKRSYQEVTEKDILWGLETLVEIEPNMLEAVEGSGGNQYKSKENSLVALVKSKTPMPVQEFVLRREMSRLMPSYLHDSTLNSLIAQQRIRILEGDSPERVFIAGKF